MPAGAPADSRNELITKITRQAETNGHRLGPWTSSPDVKGYDAAACTGCHRKIHVGPSGNSIGEALRERCTSRGNNWHRPQSTGTVGGRLVSIDKNELAQLHSALVLFEILQKARQIREPAWEQLHGQQVRVYRNLHNGLFSVQHKGLVVAHVPSIHLNDARFVVHEPGRQKVLVEKKKNVHAFVVGTVDHNIERGVQELPTSVTYNPYMHKPDEKGYFVRRHNKAPITAAKAVTLRLVDGQDKGGKPIKVAAMTALEDGAGQAPAEDHRHGLPGA